VITAAGLAAAQPGLLGPNVHAPAASGHRSAGSRNHIDDGSIRGTPQVPSMLERGAARALLLLAERVIEHRALAREIVARGPKGQNPTARHSPQRI